MIKSYHTLTIILSLSLIHVTCSYGQVLIKADTIATICKAAYNTKKDKFIITSQKEFDDSEFVTSDDGGCMPFANINFETEILVGYKYQGSNCDRRIQWSGVLTDGNDYLIQFATSPNHVCRDMQHRIAWFIIDKPPGQINISIERTTYRE